MESARNRPFDDFLFSNWGVGDKLYYLLIKPTESNSAVGFLHIDKSLQRRFYYEKNY